MGGKGDGTRPKPYLFVDEADGGRPVGGAQRHVDCHARPQVALDDGNPGFDDDGLARHQIGFAHGLQQGAQAVAQGVALVPGKA